MNSGQTNTNNDVQITSFKYDKLEKLKLKVVKCKVVWVSEFMNERIISIDSNDTTHFW